MLRKVIASLVLVAACQASGAFAADETMPKQCKRLIPLGTNIIYKGCNGSGHLSKDPRGNGVALIAKRGTALRVDRCMPMFNEKGKKIGAMYLYPFNDPRAYAWRGYSNYVRGCGAGDTRAKIRARAGSSAVFIRVRSRQGGACMKIKKAWTNVNSVQGCGR